MTIVLSSSAAAPAIDTYSDLVSEITAWSNRSDLSARIPTFIQLAQVDMQSRLKLVDLERTGTVTITAGVGDLPDDFAGARSAYWNISPRQPLTYITPDLWDARDYGSGTPSFYTVVGATMKVDAESDGSVIVTYKSRLTQISSTEPTNEVLNAYPDAYLHGALYHLYVYLRNDKSAMTHKMMFDDAIARALKDHNDRKYPGPLVVRAR